MTCSVIGAFHKPDISMAQMKAGLGSETVALKNRKQSYNLFVTHFFINTVA